MLIPHRVVGKPGIPVGPMKFKDVSADGATLRWGAPKDDGGSEITNYILEKRDSVTNMWVTVSSSVETNTMRVTGLHEGTEYIFRVCAENKYGVGEGLKSEPIVAKHPFSKWLQLCLSGISGLNIWAMDTHTMSHCFCCFFRCS